MYLQIVINTIVLLSLYLLIAKSFEIIYRMSSLFLLSHALSITVGVYVMFYLYSTLGITLWASIPIALLFVICLSVLLYFALYKPLISRQKKNWEIMISSLGVYVVFISVISLVFGDHILPFGLEEESVISWDGLFSVSNIQLITVVSSFILLLLTHFLIEKTRIGNSIKAHSSNPEVSLMYGIDRDATAILSFVIGSTLAFFAGVLIAIDMSIKQTMGFDWLMYGVVAMIIGGMGKMRYMVLGAFLLAAAQQLSAYFLDTKWMNATAYVILVIFLYFRPFGFSGKRLKKAEV